MKAIVITYEGRRPNSREIAEISAIVEDVAKGDAKIQVYTESSISKLLAETSIAPMVDVEDGNAAVTLIAGMVNKMDLPDLSVAIVKNLKDDGSETHKAFKRAVAIIANGASVDAEVARKYGFSANARDVITQLYKAWKGDE